MSTEKLNAQPIHIPALKPIFDHLRVLKNWHKIPQDDQIAFQNQNNPKLMFFVSFDSMEPNLVEASDYGNVFRDLDDEQISLVNQRLKVDDKFNAMYLDNDWGLHFECKAYDQYFDPYQDFAKKPHILYDNIQKMVNYSSRTYERFSVYGQLIE